MTRSRPKIACLSGNLLKLIAAAAMVCDHTGVILFHHIDLFRIIGRLAFPIFAFMISEGIKHTRSRVRYLLTLGGFATVIQVVYYLYSRSLQMSIMVTFTLAAALIILLDLFKSAIVEKSTWRGILFGFTFFLGIFAVCALDKVMDLDYGFAGVMVPIYASLFVAPKNAKSEHWQRLDCIPLRVFAFGIGLVALSMVSLSIQYWSLMALPLLLLYSGERGKLRMKYFFYVFYPLHLVLLEGIGMLVRYFK